MSIKIKLHFFLSKLQSTCLYNAKLWIFIVKKIQERKKILPLIGGCVGNGYCKPLTGAGCG